MKRNSKRLSNSIQERYTAISGKQEPLTFTMSRNVLIQSDKFERGLFDDPQPKDKSQFTIGGLTKQISERDLYCSIFALAQINSNQSYMSGHSQENTGLSDGVLNNALSKITGERELNGEVYFSLNEFCRLSYGVKNPSTKERKQAEALLKTLDSTPSIVEYKDKTVEAYLAKTVTRVTEKKDGSIYYHLYLHPLFVDMISKGYAQLPQNLMERYRKGIEQQGGKMTDRHIRLLVLLVQQSRDRHREKEFTRTALEILQYLKLEESYYNQKKRTMSQLKDIFEAVKCTGIITRYEMKYRGQNGKKVFDRVVFYLNPNFVKEDPLEITE